MEQDDDDNIKVFFKEYPEKDNKEVQVIRLVLTNENHRILLKNNNLYFRRIHDLDKSIVNLFFRFLKQL